MGGAQPLAATMAGGIMLAVEVNPWPLTDVLNMVTWIRRLSRWMKH